MTRRNFVLAGDNEGRFSEEAFVLGLRFGSTFVWDLTGENPTDEDCVFCDRPTDVTQVSPFNIAIPAADGQIALKGALGMLRPGYLLAVSCEHTTSFAQLTRETLAQADAAFSEHEVRLCRALGYSSYVRLEHGSDNVKSCGLGAGACIVHVHQHLIPAQAETVERMLQPDLPWQKLDSYEDLADLKGEPYLYVGHQGVHQAVVNPQVKSQWGRRIVAEEDGHNEWDWATFHHSVNLLRTFISLGYLLQGRMRVNTQSGYANFEPRQIPRGGEIHK